MPGMQWAAILLVFVVGALIAAQPGVNGQLGRRLGSPFDAALVSFGIGLAAVVVVTALVRRRLPAPADVFALPAWMWLGGGLLGATFVTTSIFVAPRIGATLFFALIVAGQMTGALVLDHFGWIGFPHDPVSMTKLLGVFLVIGGVVLISRS